MSPSAEDADSYPEYGSKEKREGAFYVWTHQEVQSVLSTAGSVPNSESKIADIVCHHFDIRLNGNVDPSNVRSMFIKSVSFINFYFFNIHNIIADQPKGDRFFENFFFKNNYHSK